MKVAGGVKGHRGTRGSRPLWFGVTWRYLEEVKGKVEEAWSSEEDTPQNMEEVSLRASKHNAFFFLFFFLIE